MTDWEKRARELWAMAWPGDDPLVDQTLKPILQLGREMADARAEEIARHAEGHINGALGWSNEARQCVAAAARSIAAFARSTIEKPEEPKPGVIMVDNPIHDILRRLEMLEAKPNTREQVLEEALREIMRDALKLMEGKDVRLMPQAPFNIARRALEWKP